MAGAKGAGMLVQARDRALLEAVASLGVLDREQAKVVGPFGSTTRANARLLALTRAGLLSRTFLGTIAGGRRAVYFPPSRRRALQSRRATATASLEHQLAVADVYHAFRSSRALTAVEWQTFAEPLVPGSRLIPDGLLRFRSGGRQLALFVEADRGTEALSIWRSKAAKYLEMAVGRQHERVCGAGPFAVLVVTDGERRCRNVARAVAQVTGKLFWLTTFEALRQHGCAAPVWLRPDESQPSVLPWNDCS